ncbi:antA/AntB antirepressor family protein [Serratia marcescens]|nr:antA/AntB antirepressor family protein [Serratia marcescens]MBH2910568.1 antA/AntB antirepressor family protein [Serratia marcescens]HCU0428874.1 antA/AntB antirepressor family protein [Serratia marcescens]
MNNQLVPVFDGTISNEPALLCNARDLHKFLEVGRDFSNWIRERISEYGFIANLDYTEFSPNSAKTGGRRRKEYHLTLDTAKELAMVERNEKGRQVRRYFIECEKRLRNNVVTTQQNQLTAPISPLNCNIMVSIENGVAVRTMLIPAGWYVGSIDDWMQSMKNNGAIILRNEGEQKEFAKDFVIQHLG